MSRADRLVVVALVSAVVYQRSGADSVKMHRAEWVICSRVAAWFGRRALAAECAYREAVSP